MEKQNIIYCKQQFIDYLNKNGLYESDIAVSCDTNEKAEILLSVFYDLGKAWSENSLLLRNDGSVVTKWGKDKLYTCYRINENNNKYIVRGHKDFYLKRNGVEVVSFDEIFPEILSKLKEIPQEIDNDKKNKKKLSLFKKEKEPETKGDIEEEDNTGEKAEETEEKMDEEEISSEIEATSENTDKPMLSDDNVVIAETEEGLAVADIKSEGKSFSSIINEKKNNEEDIFQDDLENLLSNIRSLVNKPFCIEDEMFEGRVFRFNDSLIREELKLNDFWVQCSKEWELSYILSHQEKIKIL